MLLQNNFKSLDLSSDQTGKSWQIMAGLLEDDRPRCTPPHKSPWREDLSTHSNSGPVVVVDPIVHAAEIHGRRKYWRRWSEWLAAVSAEANFPWSWVLMTLHVVPLPRALILDILFYICLSITLSNYSYKFGCQYNLIHVHAVHLFWLI